MAEEGDPKVSQRYRELPAEEPPHALDQTILAAAHRAVHKPHAPLVTPAGRHRWYYAFGAVAILVLAVAVTLQVERQQPDPEVAEAGERPRTPPADPGRRTAASKPRAPESSSPAPSQAPEARADRLESRSEAAPQAAAPPGAVGGLARFSLRDEPPERWIERIAEFRKEGRHDEADKLLAEFKQRFPDYKLPGNVVRP